MKKSKTYILRIAVPTPLRQAFDYFLPKNCNPENLIAGMRVRVPFQHRELVGILLEVVTDSAVAPARLKSALEIIDTQPVIPADILKLCLWAADYYHHPVGDVLDTALPALLRQGKPVEATTEKYWVLTAAGLALEPGVLKTAKRQNEMLQWLALHPEGVTKRQLKEIKIPGTVLKTLCAKGWVEVREIIFAAAGSENSLHETPLTLNAEQLAAVTAIEAKAGEFEVFLLDGVTGSGKTEVYLQAITHVLQRQKQVLVLVPEIGLTPQTIQRFRQRFAVTVVALHSGLSDKERLNK